MRVVRDYFITDSEDFYVRMGGEEEEVEATRAAAGAIKAIDRGVVHQICSGQVATILDISLTLFSP